MFKKQNRISRGEFESFFRGGQRFHSNSFQLVHTPLPKRLKVAVVVPKKVVKTAVGRNRLRRQINHLLRPVLKDKTGVYIVLLKKSADIKFNEDTKQELLDLVGRVG